MSTPTASGLREAKKRATARELAIAAYTLVRERGYDVRAYTGQTDSDERAESETLLKDNRVKALVATSALGMASTNPTSASSCTSSQP